MKNFIKIQLFGDPAGDPNAKGPNAAANGPQTPGADGDDAPQNAAQELLDFRKNFVTREKYEEAVKRGDDFLRAIVENREDEVIPEDQSKKIDPNKIAKDLFKEVFHIIFLQNIVYCYIKVIFLNTISECQIINKNIIEFELVTNLSGKLNKSSRLQLTPLYS